MSKCSNHKKLLCLNQWVVDLKRKQYAPKFVAEHKKTTKDDDEYVIKLY